MKEMPSLHSVFFSGPTTTTSNPSARGTRYSKRSIDNGRKQYTEIKQTAIKQTETSDEYNRRQKRRRDEDNSTIRPQPTAATATAAATTTTTTVSAAIRREDISMVESFFDEGGVSLLDRVKQKEKSEARSGGEVRRIQYKTYTERSKDRAN